MLRRVLLFALLAALLAAPAAAHTPHDVIEAWAMSPDFPKDHTLFVSLPRFNLLLRSTDGGESWITCQRGLVSVYVTQIAVSPDFARDHTLWCVEIRGLFVSTDAGETWTQVKTPAALKDVTALAVSPEGLLVAGTRRAGWWASTDRGATFREIPIANAPKPPDAVTAIGFGRKRVVHALMSSKVLAWDSAAGGEAALLGVQAPGGSDPTLATLQALAASPGEAGVVLGSRLSGVLSLAEGTGVPVALGTLPPGANVLHLSLAHDADGTRVLFASTADHGVQIRHGDGPWTASLDGFREPTHQTKLHWIGTMVSPGWASDHTVYACCFEGLFVSTDGGGKWRWLNTLHPQLVRNLALSPRFAQDGSLWLSSYGAGLLRSDDRGHTLAPTASNDWFFPDGIAVSSDWTRAAEGSPLAAATGSVLVGTPNLLLLSHDGGATVASCLPAAKGFPRYVAFAPDWPDSHTAFAFLVADTGRLKDNQLLRTTDGGANWEPTTLGSAYDLAFAPDWHHSGHAWAAGADGVFVSIDRGQSFTRLETMPAAAITSLALAPGEKPDAPPCLAAAARGTGVFLTRDGGKTWQQLPGPPPLPGFVELSPGFVHDGLIFAGTPTDGVWLSRDAGATWSRTPGGPRDVLAMEMSPTFAQDHTLLVGTYEQPWITEDAGASWRAIVVPVPEGYVPDPSRESATGSPIPPAPRK